MGATRKRIIDNEFCFFKKYEMPRDFFIGATSVVTAPIICTGFSIAALLKAGCLFLKTVADLFTFDFSDAGKNIKNSAEWLGVSSILLIAAVLSPLINLIDLIGSAITSIKQAVTPEKFSPI